jgi:hypothetical protein
MRQAIDANQHARGRQRQARDRLVNELFRYQARVSELGVVGEQRRAADDADEQEP